MLQDLPCRKSENFGIKVKNFTFCFYFLMKPQEKLVSHSLSDEVNNFVENEIRCQYILMEAAVSHMDIWSFFIQ